jgi:hypothetical protein
MPANVIELASAYVPFLDEAYAESSKTSILDGNPELVAVGANANELIIPRMDMSGLSDYLRNDGYSEGTVTMTNQTVTCNYDRGTMFTIDNMDNLETAGIGFGRLAGEFIRTRVVPELDAFRIATYAAAAGANTETALLTTGKEVLAALRAGTTALDDAEVPAENRILFLHSGLYGMIMDENTDVSRYVLQQFSQVVSVSSGRMNTGVTLESGGFTLTGDPLNFLIAHRAAVIQFQKHIAPKIVTPEANQTADAWKFGYRTVGVADVYANKVAGLYAHVAGEAAGGGED